MPSSDTTGSLNMVGRERQIMVFGFIDMPEMETHDTYEIRRTRQSDYRNCSIYMIIWRIVSYRASDLYLDSRQSFMESLCTF